MSKNENPKILLEKKNGFLYNKSPKQLKEPQYNKSPNNLKTPQYNKSPKQLKEPPYNLYIMLFYIHYKRTFDDTLFKLWLNHYNILQIPYNIYVDKNDIDFFTANYPYTKNIINTIPMNITMLTEFDFLMSYTVDENDIMILSYNIDHNELLENNIIGRLFYVPVQPKILYTTFGILMHYSLFTLM
jgi:hypothetical protein